MHYAIFFPIVLHVHWAFIVHRYWDLNFFNLKMHQNVLFLNEQRCHLIVEKKKETVAERSPIMAWGPGAIKGAKPLKAHGF